MPADALWGPQTERARSNFAVSGVTTVDRPDLLVALAEVKIAGARVNGRLGVFPMEIVDLVVDAAGEIAAGRHHEAFPIDLVQGGGGTATNMNMNEVVANLANLAAGGPLGAGSPVHPNDHVNRSQSTNDAYPTAFRIALINRMTSYAKALALLRDAFRDKGWEFAKVLKMGRTHLQDAVPMSMGDEFHGFATNLDEELARIEDAKRLLSEVNMGATAIGTSVNAPEGYPDLVVKYLREITGIELKLAADLVEATSDAGAYVQLSGVLKRTAVKLSKICNDLRLLASGPRTGFNEINLPQLQPGSSIMPGKVNPVIPEVVNQTTFYVIGCDLTVTLAASAGQLQLNVMEPVLGFALFTSIKAMENAVIALREKCVVGITANAERTREMVLGSLGIVTQLSPILGYKVCAELAREGYLQNKSLQDIVVKERKLITQEKWDEVFSIENLIHPRFIK